MKMSYGFWNKIINPRYLEKKSAILFLTLASSLAIIFLTMSVPQGLYIDFAEQMKALEQYLQGYSPSFNHLVEPSPRDLSLDQASWIVVWPPGTQIFAYPLMISGIKTGVALRIIAAIFLVLGSLGWLRWFLLFKLPLWVKIFFALMLPWMRYSSSALFMYSAEILLFCFTPWILLATYKYSGFFMRQDAPATRVLFTSALLGLALGFFYILKYSSVFISLGALVYLGFLMHYYLKGRGFNIHSYPQIGFILAVIFFVLSVVAWNLVNYKLSGYMNMVTVKMGLNLSWKNILFVLANPALAIADADSMWRYLLLHPDYGVLKNNPWLIQESSMWLAFIGLPGSLILLWLISKSNQIDNLKRLALSVFFTSIVVMFLLWTLSYSFRSYQARYLVVPGITILPLVIQSGLYLWQRRGWMVRLILLGAASAYLFIPLLYGSVSVVEKARRTPRDYAVGPACIYNTLLSNFDIKGVRNKLIQDFIPSEDIWYLPEPVSALDIPGRAIIGFADFTDCAELRRAEYSSSRPLRVHVLIPDYFEKNMKGPAIRSSFLKADGWSKRYIEGCKYVCWTTVLRVSSQK